MYENIADLLGVKLDITQRSHGDFYSIECTSPAKLKVFADYLDRFPLFTSKFLDYSDFRICLNMMLVKDHLSVQGRILVQRDSFTC